MFVALRPAGGFGVLHPHREVMTVVTALAKRRQVAQIVVARVVVKVRDRELHPRTRVRVGSMIEHPAELAVIARPVEADELAYLLPAVRVQGLVFDRHQLCTSGK